MKITTNNVPRWLVPGFDVPAKVLESEFDYVPEDDRYNERFFKYRGAWYDVHEFSRVQVRGASGWNPMCHTAEPDEPLAEWDAIAIDSFFSAVVLKLCGDGDRIIVGTLMA